MRKRETSAAELAEAPPKTPSFPVLAAQWVPKLRAVQREMRAMAAATTKAERAAAEMRHALARTTETEAWKALQTSRTSYLAAELPLPDAASLPEPLPDTEPEAPAE